MKILVKIKLLEDKYIEARSYELFKEPIKLIHCTALDYKICTHENCEFMLLSLAQQNKGRVVNTQQSKFPPYSYYKIYKFLWKPQKPVKEIDEPINVGVAMASNIDKNQESWEALRAKLHS
jgi:hypothetical protein